MMKIDDPDVVATRGLRPLTPSGIVARRQHVRIDIELKENLNA